MSSASMVGLLFRICNLEVKLTRAKNKLRGELNIDSELVPLQKALIKMSCILQYAVLCVTISWHVNHALESP